MYFNTQKTLAEVLRTLGVLKCEHTEAFEHQDKNGWPMIKYVNHLYGGAERYDYVDQDMLFALNQRGWFRRWEQVDPNKRVYRKKNPKQKQVLVLETIDSPKGAALYDVVQELKHDYPQLVSKLDKMGEDDLFVAAYNGIYAAAKAKRK